MPERLSAMGFTLLETLVVLALLGILLSLAVPAVSDLRSRHLVQAQAEGFLNSLVLARSEALRRQQRLTLCARASDSVCDTGGHWQQGWLVFVDANDNGTRESDELLIEVHPSLPPGIGLEVSNTAPAYFSYGAEGRSQSNQGAFMAGTWRFCHAPSPLGWRVVNNALGKPRIEKYTAETCQ